MNSMQFVVNTDDGTTVPFRQDTSNAYKCHPTNPTSKYDPDEPWMREYSGKRSFIMVYGSPSSDLTVEMPRSSSSTHIVHARYLHRKYLELQQGAPRPGFSWWSSLLTEIILVQVDRLWQKVGSMKDYYCEVVMTTQQNCDAQPSKLMLWHWKQSLE
jgi:hypothetical protein